MRHAANCRASRQDMLPPRLCRVRVRRHGAPPTPARRRNETSSTVGDKSWFVVSNLPNSSRVRSKAPSGPVVIGPAAQDPGAACRSRYRHQGGNTDVGGICQGPRDRRSVPATNPALETLEFSMATPGSARIHLTPPKPLGIIVVAKFEGLRARGHGKWRIQPHSPAA